MKMEIDVAEFAEQLKAGKGIGGKDGALTPLIKQLTEMALTYRELYCESCEKEFYVKAPASGKFAEHKSETQAEE